MRLVRGVLVCLAASLIGLVPTVGAASATDSLTADLAMESELAHGPLESTVVRIPLKVHNYGPNVVQTGASLSDIRLPQGTEFWDSRVPSYCTVIVPGQHLRCTSQVMIYPDDDNPSGVPGAQTFYLEVRIVAKCTAPGEYRVEYPHDPDPSNNSAPLVVAVDGVDPSTCESTPTPKPSTPKPTPTRVASGGGGADSHGGSLPITGAPTALILGVGAMLLGFGAGLFLAGRRRDSRTIDKGGVAG